jgi:hypothetical protein
MYKKECLRELEVIGFQDLVASTQQGGHIGGASLLMLNTCAASLFAVLLTCGSLQELSSGEENEDLESAMHVEVEVDGWLSVQMRKEHLLMVINARHLLTTALLVFLQNPTKPLDKTMEKGVEKLVEVLALEQRACS